MSSAIFKFYCDSTRYNLAFSILLGLMIHPIVGVAALPTFGLLVGFICYRQFHRQQYYFYYNLGITKQRLVVVSLVTNLVISIPLLLLFF